MRHIPNFITSLNLSAGFISIIFALNGDLTKASWLILAAMIFDFLDGLSARLLKAFSVVGKELDSLADVVSFGVAPGVIIFQMLNDTLSLYTPTIINSNGLKESLILLIPVIMPICAALRLAKFNVDSTQAATFKGLPTPANAIAVISLVIAGNYSESGIIESITGSTVMLIILTVLLSILMVSRISLLSLKIDSLRPKGNEGRYILVLTVLAAFAIFGISAAPLIIPLYIISSFLSLII